MLMHVVKINNSLRRHCIAVVTKNNLQPTQPSQQTRAAQILKYSHTHEEEEEEEAIVAANLVTRS